MSNHNIKHEQWSSRLTYMLAATGAAVGLGNIWKFPYIMGENGGGAFVLVYLGCILLIGIPVMMSEVLIGKVGRQAPARSARLVAAQSGGSKHWSVVGWFGSVAGFLILSFYVVIAGWALAYTFYGFSGDFTDKSPAQIGNIFSTLNQSGGQLMAWSGVIIFATTVIVGLGVKAGLERAVNWMMPALFVLLLVMVGYAASTGDMGSAMSFMFNADFSKLSWNGVLVALGHSFFTLSLASGIMTMYGAYLPEKTSLVKTSLWIAIMDTVVALLAGIAIYPIVFANGLEPGAGPGLIFQTLPIAFGSMPGGQFFGGLFFLMLVVAALTSALALIESSVAWLVENRGFKRMQAAVVSGFSIWLLSLLTVFSISGESWTVVTLFATDMSLFDILDFTTSNVMLPLGGLMTAVFVGYVVNTEISKRAIDSTAAIYRLWWLCVRYVAPIAIVLVFLQLSGIVSF
ncbi:sodium-dependent transporter [Ferrimonas lipolytica]|uniref:Transporter n=1 Tax=Ferrimonas lipolytica TaxID=2724191 RepID=A0A6H1UCI9_9GAMM|nr:sodium-dependent transporter [Ferrimonas lipolytica]QIZ76558.1 sodium-dependent transporter [Ferrimonas lipolytica]